MRPCRRPDEVRSPLRLERAPCAPRARPRGRLGLLGLLALSACGSGSSGGGDPVDPGATDALAPSAVVQFPPPGSLTDAPEIGVLVAALDETGVAAVTIAGIPAALVPGRRWSARVPLADGENTLHVETRDLLGNTNASAARVTLRRRSALWIETAGVAFDADRGEALVLDTAQSALFAVTSTAGVPRPLSGTSAGSGPSFRAARAVVFVSSGNAALVTDGGLDAVFRVDLTTGGRSILSSAQVGAGPAPLDLHGLALDAARSRVLVLDEGRAELTAVDLATGARSAVSSDITGDGPTLAAPRRVALDPIRGRALVTLAGRGVLLAIDLASGNRSVLSGEGTGAGVPLVAPLDLVVDPFLDRVLVVDPGARAVLAIDPTSGDRSVLSSADQGSGPSWLRPAGIALDLAGRPLVVDAGADALVEVGPVSGERRVLAEVAHRAGPQLSAPAGIALGLSAPERLLVADAAGLFTLDPASGARVQIAALDPLAVPPLLAPIDVLAPRAQQCLRVLDAGLGALLELDPFGGSRRILSGAGAGSGPPFIEPCRLAFEDPPALQDCAANVLVLDRAGDGALLRVSPTTGARTVVSDATHGFGPVLAQPAALHVDGRLGVAHVLVGGVPERLLEVDLRTGDRTELLDFRAPFSGPTDLVFEAGRERFLVTLADFAALAFARPGDGVVGTVSGLNVGSGPRFGRPIALELAPSATLTGTDALSIAYVADALRGALLAVDTISGERVIVSK